MRTPHRVKIEAAVARRLAALENQPKTYSKLRVLVDDCGWRRRGSTNLEQIQRAFVERGVYPEPMLTAPGIDWQDTIFFSKIKPADYRPERYAPRVEFASEAAMRDFLVDNFALIRRFAPWKSPEPEFKLPSRRTIDILCRERRSGDYVVIELKNRQTDPTDQLHGYLREIAPIARQVGVGVKGVIITTIRSDVLARELTQRITDFPVEWFECELDLKLHARS